MIGAPASCASATQIAWPGQPVTQHRPGEDHSIATSAAPARRHELLADNWELSVMRGRVVLGVHIGHDRGAAVVSGGKLAGALAQERVDRRKHSPSPELPYAAID